MAAAYDYLGTMEFLAGEYDKAQSYLQQSIALYRELADKRYIGIELHELGNVATAQHEYMVAAHFYAESLAIRREFGDRRGISWLHLDLGYLALYQEDTDRALTLFRESLSVLRDIRDHEGLAHCLVALGVWMVAQGQPEQGTRLLGAAEAVLEGVDCRLQFEHRVVHMSTIAALHTQLDEATFAAMWAEGRAMSLEQALAYALQQTSRPNEKAGVLHEARLLGR